MKAKRHRALRIVGGIIAGLALAAVLVIYFFNWNMLRPVIARKSKEATGRELLIAGDLRPRWRWPPGLSANDVTFENPAWAAKPMLFKAKHVEISISLLPLLRHQLIFPYLEVEEGAVYLERENGFGTWSVTAAKPQADPQPKAPPEAEAKPLIIRNLELKKTLISYHDKNQPLVVEVMVQQGHLAGSGAVWRIYDADLTTGKTEVKGNFELDVRSKLKMTAQLHAPRLHIDDILTMIGKSEPASAAAKAKAPEPAVKTGPVFSGDPLALNFLKAFDADFDVRIDRLTKAASPTDLLTQGVLELHLLDGKLEVPQLAFVRGETGEVKASALLDSRRKPFQAKLDLAFARLDFGAFVDKAVNGFKEKKADAGEKVAKPVAKEVERVADNTYGHLGGKLHLSSRGQSPAELARNLQGDAGIAMEQGHISDVLTYITAMDVGKTIGRYLRGDKGSDVQCLVVTSTVASGKATLDTALMSTKEANIRATGAVDLGAEGIDLKISTYPKKISIDSLRAPIRIKGPWSDIKVKPEAGPMLARVGAALALGIVLTPPAAILPFVEAGLGNKGACAQHLNELSALKGKAVITH